MKRFFCLCFAAVIFFGILPFVGSAAPEVAAKSAFLMDITTGTVLYEHNAHEKLPPASVTKVMTMLLIMEAIDDGRLKWDDTVTASENAAAKGGSQIYLKEGETMSVADMVKSIAVSSANDCACAMAEHLWGSEESFVEKMNQKAEALGLSDTHFTNPHGLDHEEHYTSAADLARLAAYCIHNELFRTIVSTRRMTIPLNDQEGARLLLNHNRLLRSYDGTIGLKTGFTKRSGRCLVSAAERDGVTMIAVTLNAPDDWNDHRNMLDYGFSQYTALLLQASGSYERAIPLVGMPQPEIIISNQNDIRVILPSDHGPIRMYCEAPRWLGGNIL